MSFFFRLNNFSKTHFRSKLVSPFLHWLDNIGSDDIHPNTLYSLPQAVQVEALHSVIPRPQCYKPFSLS
jgi:hypothetical protein